MAVTAVQLQAVVHIVASMVFAWLCSLYPKAREALTFCPALSKVCALSGRGPSAAIQFSKKRALNDELHTLVADDG